MDRSTIWWSLGAIVVIVASILIYVVIATGGGGSDDASVAEPTGESSFTLDGVVKIMDVNAWKESGEGCVGTSDLAHITDGASLVVSNGETGGNEVTTSLTGGDVQADRSCQFAFSLETSPATTYQFAIGETVVECPGSTVGTEGDERSVDIVMTLQGAGCRVGSS